MKKVIITGASGFIGKALTKHLLDQDIEVYAIVRDPQKLSDLSTYSNLKIVTCEMSEYSSLADKITERDFDVCFHLAWEGAMGEKIQHLETQLKNIQYSSDLMISISALKTNRFIFVDTISQYKFIPIINDGVVTNKNFDIYGIAKQATYKFLIQLASTLNIHLNSVIMANVYGIGDYSKRSTNIIINNFFKNISPNLADGKTLYDWTYIDDVVQGLVAVSQKGKKIKRYYLGHRKLKTFEELITTVRDTVNPNIELKFGTYHDISFIDFHAFFNDDLYQDTGFEITSDFKDNILKTTEWVKTLNF